MHPVTTQQDSCAACNCPLDSNQDLDNYITGRINEIMGNEPRKQKKNNQDMREGERRDICRECGVRERERERERERILEI